MLGTRRASQGLKPVAFAVLLGCGYSAYAADLLVYPPEVRLAGLHTEQRLIVVLRDGDSVTDVTRQATFRVKGEAVRMDGPVVRPRAEGAAEIVVSMGKLSRTAAVTVSAEGPVTFAHNVQPVLAKAGCAARACHGADGGQNGFQLSLFNFDPAADAQMISKADGGRRVNIENPEESLLVLKPTARVQHTGMQRIKPGGPAERSLIAWIAAGAPADTPDQAYLTGLELALPKDRFEKADESCQALVLATFSDGRVMDVTGLCKFSTTDDGVGAVTDDGLFSALRRGEVNLIARYGRYIASKPVMVDIPLKKKPPVIARFTPATRIDEVLVKRWERMGIAPSSQVRDNTFVRRVYLDLIGTLPTPEQIADYADDRSPKKREHLIDKLLRRPEFIYYWTQWWGDMLRVERRTMKERGVKAISRYLRTAILQNRPLDQMARELLTATGRSYDNGPVNFYSPIRRPQQAVVQFSSVFMGVRMECAQCHNHPYESWTQNDFYNLAMFFRQTRLKGGPEKDEITLEDLPKPQGLRIPNRAGNVQAQPILPGEREVARTSQNLRSVLADWITSKENPYFAQSMANRIWARLMGRGVFEPLDDYRATNPPVDRELLQVLSDLFVESGFDMRALIKQVVMSRAYSVSSEANPSNESDTKYFSRYYAKRLAAEVFVDAVCDVTGRRERYSGYDPGTRAIQLEDVNVYSRFLDVFNRPKRRIVICNRNNDPSLVQALFLMNNGAIHNKIASKEGSIANWLKVGARPQQIVDRLFTYCLGRLPRAKESETINGFLMKSRDPKPVLEDVLWALINSREFQYNH